MALKRRSWFLVRVAVYVAAIAILFIVRGGVGLKSLRRVLDTTAAADSALVIGGRDLAPDLVDRLLTGYQRDYPRLKVALTVGGTNQALEDLLNRRTQVAFLYRPPTRPEQEALRKIDGDTAVVVPVAVGGLQVLTAAPDTAAATLDQLRDSLAGRPGARWQRAYLPDPNQGEWDALAARLGGPAEPGPGVMFLRDAAAVVAAVAADSGTCGIVSTFGQDVRAATGRVRPVAVPVPPTFTNLVTGDYQLYHWLYVACRARGRIEGTKFVTHLASPRGQRQVERTGVVPAQQTGREIILTRDPPGS
jgi:phosphate transport system substrate-binding protein